MYKFIFIINFNFEEESSPNWLPYCLNMSSSILKLKELKLPVPVTCHFDFHHPKGKVWVLRKNPHWLPVALIRERGGFSSGPPTALCGLA